MNIKKAEAPFWERKNLEEMTPAEWEQLCDGCGRCCLCKLEDDTTGEVLYTSIACWLLESHSCRCRSYAKRKELVPGCMILTPQNVKQFHWLPETCAYRRLTEGKDLYRWHHLICGSRDRVHDLGLSVRGKVISETEVAPGQLEDYIVDGL